MGCTESCPPEGWSFLPQGVLGQEGAKEEEGEEKKGCVKKERRERRIVLQISRSKL